MYKFINSKVQKNFFNIKNIGDKLHLITYGNNKFTKAKKRIFKEALDTNWFYSINTYDDTNLSAEFKNEFNDILIKERGGGYWIWKFDIILRKLNEIDEGDFLIYLDAGCTINSNGKDKLIEYIEMIKKNKNKIISYQLSGLEYYWTTKEIFNSFDISLDHKHATSKQFAATIIIMQKCDKVINIFKDCLIKIRKDPFIITDKYNNKQNKDFIDNRHDQSILSIARKIHGSIIVTDNSNPKNKLEPFLSSRSKKGINNSTIISSEEIKKKDLYKVPLKKPSWRGNPEAYKKWRSFQNI